MLQTGLKIYGSPYQPYFFNWAFNQARGNKSKQRWSKIPQNCDIVLTHGPPFLHGDRTNHVSGTQLENQYVGCKELLKRLNQVKPKYHVSGHLHEGWGVSKDKTNDVTTFINASTVDAAYHVKTRSNHMANPPVLFKIAKPKQGGNK